MQESVYLREYGCDAYQYQYVCINLCMHVCVCVCVCDMQRRHTWCDGSELATHGPHLRGTCVAQLEEAEQVTADIQIYHTYMHVCLYILFTFMRKNPCISCTGMRASLSLEEVKPYKC